MPAPDRSGAGTGVGLLPDDGGGRSGGAARAAHRADGGAGAGERRSRCRRTPEQVPADVERQTFLTAEDAVAYGLVDGVVPGRGTLRPPARRAVSRRRCPSCRRCPRRPARRPS
ncbi:ATP-dependent Clp protease proteolytic subunit [Streptomyces asoensis]|uniref:ATP-dependent Clp protease proteolytic subunit n=1 Tax=Streptomyces asoensis TaxID=249586 RepID=UPI003F541984